MHFKITATLVFAIITVNNSENKFEDFKNINKNPQNQGNSDQNDLIKMEIKKYMSECGGDVSNDEDDSEPKNNKKPNSSSSNYNHNNNRGGGNNYNSRGYNNRDKNNQNNDDGQNYGDSYPSHDYNQGTNRDYHPQANYGSWGGSPSNMNYNRSSMGNYGSYGTKHDPYGPGSFDYRHGGYPIRSKRSNDDDSECISQCVFGYLEVLDDNRSPSESALIKWLQDHLPNDTKRIKAIRDARRCFARLAASDNEDGCAFSKSLSKCLNLEIEQ